MKKSNKGFTLVEIIAVIAILGVVLTIAVLSVHKLFRKNKESAYDSKVAIILKQAKQYALDEESVLYGSASANKRYGNYVCATVTVGDLLTKGYLDKTDKDLTDGGNVVVNPKDNSSMNNMRILLYIKSKDTPSSPDYDTVGVYNGTVIAELDNQSSTNCTTKTGSTVAEFNNGSTPAEFTYTVPYTGKYLLEVWGAQGGNGKIDLGGYGAYAQGIITLNQNGGRNATTGSWGYGGGGATSIALSSGLLTSFSSNRTNLLIVAAGGGGNGGSTNAPGGSGGGIIGSTGFNPLSATFGKCTGRGGTQTAGGASLLCTGAVAGTTSSFGKGANYYDNGYGGAGGGGGFYGGGGSSSGYGGAGGGSSYISSTRLSNAIIYFL